MVAIAEGPYDAGNWIQLKLIKSNRAVGEETDLARWIAYPKVRFPPGSRTIVARQTVPRTRHAHDYGEAVSTGLRERFSSMAGGQVGFSVGGGAKLAGTGGSPRRFLS